VNANNAGGKYKKLLVIVRRSHIGIDCLIRGKKANGESPLKRRKALRIRAANVGGSFGCASGVLDFSL
jgi:hypothetical protein